MYCPGSIPGRAQHIGVMVQLVSTCDFESQDSSSNLDNALKNYNFLFGHGQRKKEYTKNYRLIFSILHQYKICANEYFILGITYASNIIIFLLDIFCIVRILKIYFLKYYYYFP